MRKHVKTLLIAGAFALAAFLIVSPLGIGLGDKPASASNNALTGEYLQTNDTGNAYFSGEVTDGKIKIVLRLHDPAQNEGDADAAGTYWVGSFDTSNVSDNFTTVSDADKKALEFAILGSQDDTKKFTYKNGDLSFEFAMDSTGVKTTVHLSK